MISSGRQARRGIFGHWKLAYDSIARPDQILLHKWLAVSVSGRVIQAVGVVSILPFIALVDNPSILHENWLLSAAYERSFSDSYSGFLQLVGVVTLMFYWFASSFTCFEVWYGARVTHWLGLRCSLDVFKKSLGKHYTHHLTHDRAEAVKFVTEEAEETLVGILVTGVEIVSNAVLVVLIGVALTVVNYAVAMTTTAVLIVLFLFIHFTLNSRIESLGARLYYLGIERFRIVTDALNGIREIKAYQSEHYTLNKYERTSEALVEESIRHALIEFLPRQLLEVAVFTGILLLTLISLVNSSGEQALVPLIALYGFAAYRLIPALREMFSDLETVRFASLSFDRLSAAMSKSQDTVSNLVEPHDLSVGIARDESLIELNSVSYRYPSLGTRNAVTDVSLSIDNGQHVALIGQSGAGKSTVIDLLSGLLVPDSGYVSVGGNQLNKRNISAWRAQVGYVSQQVSLFECSLRENITLRPDSQVMNDQLLDVCQLSCLDSLINRLPNGLDTVIGGGAHPVGLSGGERKRIGIARALYRQPRLLILDESLNEVDRSTAEAIMGSIWSQPSLAVLLVTHQQWMLEHFDQIVELELGDVGPPDSVPDITGCV